MRRIAALTYGITGQTLDVLVRLGRPTSATFEVFRQSATDDGTPEFQGSATVDTPNTTLASAAGPAQSDPARIPLTSTTGIVKDRRYLLSQNSLQEWVDVVEVGSGYVRVRQQLQNDYTSGATFQSTYLTAAVNSSFIQNLSNLSDLLDTTPDYRVVWTVVVGGQTYQLYTFFDVVRTPVLHNVEISDIDAAVPGLADTMPVELRAEQGRPLIDRAFSSVRADLVASQIDVNSLRDDEVMDELVILRTIRSLAEGGWAPPGVDKNLFLETSTKNYERFLERHIAVSLNHATASRDGASALAEPVRSAWSK